MNGDREEDDESRREKNAFILGTMAKFQSSSSNLPPNQVLKTVANASTDIRKTMTRCSGEIISCQDRNYKIK
ncbi:hypothetical protein Pyn_29991 [Prunus yedoensis var. nudiflora]|uniref:Uncharacterized protein n=1 Tax=Prunus yedoensis var. nudiflora TaxID=2094558 RepID=A0A314YPG1_PRUYE|nr:hypothetical protein Pyn_29991 [Prunus yedoensis var. nudiflora]